MASPLVATLTQISAAWEALTPPDRTAVTYHEIDGSRALSGVAADRSFIFGMPRRGIISAQATDSGGSLVPWECSAELRLSSSGRSRRALINASINEATLLLRYIETQTNWPAGVIEVYDAESEAELMDDEDAMVTLRWVVSCAETD